MLKKKKQEGEQEVQWWGEAPHIAMAPPQFSSCEKLSYPEKHTPQHVQQTVNIKENVYTESAQHCFYPMIPHLITEPSLVFLTIFIEFVYYIH